jgi:hypothetical protein
MSRKNRRTSGRKGGQLDRSPVGRLTLPYDQAFTDLELEFFRRGDDHAALGEEDRLTPTPGPGPMSGYVISSHRAARFV